MTNTDDLLKDFYATANKIERVSQSKYKPPYKNKVTNKRKTSNFYEKYKYKLDNNQFDKFGTRDFVYFFRDTANESGVKYVIPNIKRDMKVFKTLREREYTNEEILLMVEFLFKSNQDYLNKRDIQPTILISGWCNKIYQDSQDWLNDKYVPKSKEKFSKREYVGDTDETKVQIGEWDI